ncbi:MULTISPECIES: Rv1355c family protein [unclassified Rhodococcus (in: high G+C Gram-positive bacteria)]|uniref:Rv1355c family protein n=1 Tax=unclassified Rhodococcus (in: high G+C Gram-positive bacteria) TaxID=192944 RepID=UPI0019D25D6B|nr:Rv1355c family protein [Rhodococcus sp. KRD197]
MSEHSVFDPSEREQDSVVRALLDDPTVGVVDTTLEQLASLRRLLPAMTGKTEELPRWVHYPWRRTLVRVLGPRSFDRLRLDRNRNKITSAEQARFRGLRVGVVGLSVGHAVAHTLAMEGLCGELRLADFDELDLSNLNRVPSSVFDLGLNKAVVAARRIAELDPYLNVRVFADGVTAETLDNFLDGLDLVVEECDSIDTKLLVRHHARARGIPVVMETSDGGVLDVERFDLEPDRPVFHGLLGEMTTADVADLTVEQKSTIAATLLEPTKLTPRMIASVPEIGRTLSTWPQLGGDVALGGAAVTAAVRAFGRGEPLSSGRRRIDLDSLVRTGVDPTAGYAGG